MQPQKKKNIVFDPSEEQAVGIRQFITHGEPIPAITKYMLSDFIVNEIDVNQNVVVVENKPLSIKNIQQTKKQADYTMTQQLFKQISTNLSQQAAKQIEKLYEKVESGQRMNDWEYVIQNVTKDKAERLLLHNFVREKLENIESNTLQNNRIRLKFNKKMKKIKPESRKKYIHFKLYKCNIDTMGALFKLSKITGISHKIFSSAGLKDKRGITTQMVSVFNSDINNLKRFYQQAERNRQIWIDGFQQLKDDAIAVGCLYGNQFGLVLRLINPQDSELIKDRIEAIKQKGIINYFGMQRFGSCATKTHLIGVKIIKRQWKQLVQELILEQTNIEQVNKIKHQLYLNKEYHKADRLLSNKFKIQKCLFNGLAKYGENYLNVFESLSRSIKTLYCHALQSYVWNRMTSRRVKEFGTKLVVGDLVGVVVGQNKIETQKNMTIKDNIQENKQLENDIDQQIGQQEAVEEDQPMQIVLITEQNIHLYQFSDIVAPLYGISINLPEQSIMSKYLEDQLKMLDLKKQDFQEKSKSLCFKGAYRKCIVKSPLIECEIVSHKEKKVELLSPFYMKKEELVVQKGELRSARVILQLPKSSYATIAIRQILHIPSSFKVQQQLNRIYDTK